MQKPIPVTVLTGHLGAGKTTLLNRILSLPHGRRFGVIVNEYSEIGIDADLIVGADEQVIEMNNGCVCCSIRGDLISSIETLLERSSGLDGILVETTGLADPAPVAQTFFVNESVRERTKLDAVVTVVDAKWLDQSLIETAEANSQIAFADVIMINKVDLVSADELQCLEAKIRSINPYAKLHHTTRGVVDVLEVLDRNAFDLERIMNILPDFLVERHHHHHTGDPELQIVQSSRGGHDHTEVGGHGRIGSMAISVSAPLSSQRFFAWIQDLVATEGQNLLRSKGVLWFEGDEERFVFHGVRMILDGNHQRAWRKDEQRTSRLVFIGWDLPEQQIRDTFPYCYAERPEWIHAASC